MGVGTRNHRNVQELSGRFVLLNQKLLWFLNRSRAVALLNLLIFALCCFCFVHIPANDSSTNYISCLNNGCRGKNICFLFISQLDSIRSLKFLCLSPIIKGVLLEVDTRISKEARTPSPVSQRPTPPPRWDNVKREQFRNTRGWKAHFD